MASRKLSTYRAKRDFRHTAEPSGCGAVAPSPRLRFAHAGGSARRVAGKSRGRRAAALERRAGAAS
jgi:hypothetical protein